MVVSLYNIWGKDMKIEDFKTMVREIIREELSNLAKRGDSTDATCEGEGCLEEKSVPQPYNRKSARKMSKSQVEKRKKIGRDMMSNEKTASKFRKKYGDEWKDYLWAAASSAAFRQSGSSKADDKKN
jgi:glutamate synthase domain-containing protein 1